MPPVLTGASDDRRCLLSLRNVVLIRNRHPLMVIVPASLRHVNHKQFRFRVLFTFTDSTEPVLEPINLMKKPFLCKIPFSFIHFHV